MRRSSCTGCGTSRKAAVPSCTGWGLVAQAVGLVAQAVGPSCTDCGSSFTGLVVGLVADMGLVAEAVRPSSRGTGGG